MSKILRRPMFRGGGKVSSYGNGIATGLADGYEKGGSIKPRQNFLFGGSANVVPQASYDSGRVMGSGRGLTKGTRTARLLSQLRPLGTIPSLSTIGTLASPFALPAGLAYLNRAKTDEGLKFMKNEPSGTFDETGAFEIEAYSDGLRKANEQGNKISFMDNFFLDPETGTYPKFIGRSGDRDKRAALAAEKAEKEMLDLDKTDDSIKISDAELRAQMENKRLTELLDSFGAGSNKEDTEEEALAAIEKKQKLLEKVMGGGKSAKIADASDMALNFASKALGEGATVKSAFADFLGDESKRPSRSQKVKDAAANAAIQAYLTEKISEKDFSKQMQLITGQAQIKQKFAEAAKANLTVQDYVTNRGSGTSKSEAIENGARGIAQNNDKYKGFTAIDSKDNIPGLLVPKNLGEVFMDKKTREVFAVVLLEDGITVGKEILYN